MKTLVVVLLIALIVLGMLSLVGCGSNAAGEGDQIRTPEKDAGNGSTNNGSSGESNHSDECPT